MNVTVTKKNESVIHNGKIYKHGESFTVEEVIGKSLIERGYVAVTGEEEQDEAELKIGTLDAEQLRELSYPKLKQLAAQMGVEAKGSKEELIAKITAVEVGIGEEEEEEQTSEEEEEEISDELPNTDMPE